MTIKDIARLSGYGVSTVSRALNAHPDISEATREKILKVARENNFVPNENARQLKSSSSKTVSVIVKGTFNVFFSGLIENLQTLLDASGYNVQLHYLHTSADELELAKKVLLLEKPLGIIFLGGSVSAFEEKFSDTVKVPAVLCTTTASSVNADNLSSVSVDDREAGERAIDYLVSNGHKKIGIIGGDIESVCATGLRFIGCKNSLERNGISFDLSFFEKAEFDFESSYTAAQRLIKRKPELTAVFAMSDTMAIGAIRALEDLGLSVPDDVSVLGFDGIDYACFSNPRITTYKQPQDEIAELTVRLLNDMLWSNARSRHVLLNARFQPGGSVRGV